MRKLLLVFVLLLAGCRTVEVEVPVIVEVYELPDLSEECYDNEVGVLTLKWCAVAEPVVHIKGKDIDVFDVEISIHNYSGEEQLIYISQSLGNLGEATLTDGEEAYMNTSFEKVTDGNTLWGIVVRLPNNGVYRIAETIDLSWYNGELEEVETGLYYIESTFAYTIISEEELENGFSEDKDYQGYGYNVKIPLVIQKMLIVTTN